jgi:hypothetical protein
MFYRTRQLGTTAQTAVSTVQQAGGAAVAYGTATHAAWAGPVGLAVAGVAIAVGLILSRKGPQQRIASTAIVNELEPLLRQNVDAYFGGPRTRSSQAQALKTFDDAWAYLISAQACGAPELGNPGRACISDRQAGASTWTDANGQPWNWFIGYRDPIALDTAVKPDPLDQVADIFSPLTGTTSSSGKSAWPLAIAAGLAAVGFFL